MKKIIAASAVAFGLAALGSAGAQASGPDPRVGAEVNRICFARNINDWREIKGEDRAVLLRASTRRWYKVELAGACFARDFAMATRIALDTRPAGGCVGPGDAIVIDHPGALANRCMITRIFEWNPRATAPETEETGGEDDSGA
jgi:hypothetical protein